jgi:hypothetical protein
MTKQLVTDDFGADWPREKLMCYWVLDDAMKTLGCIELIQESKLNGSDSEQALEGALRHAKATMDAVKELYQLICKKEREGTL